MAAMGTSEQGDRHAAGSPAETQAIDVVLEAASASGLLPRVGALVLMLSGGQDSVCLLDVAVKLCPSADVHALHVNYGLRREADRDEAHCAQLCAQLHVPLEVVAAHLPERHGNVQAWARDVRYGAAARRAKELKALIAVGHTATDQVETILYRLAASPGRRALLGMAASDGRIVRPLLAVSREQTARYCEARRLAWREDLSNLDARYARNRVRHQLLSALRAVHPAAEANVLRTAELLRAEAALLEAIVTDVLEGSDDIEIARLAALPRPLARMVVIRLAERAADDFVPQAGKRVDELLQLARRGGRAQLHVGGNVSAVIERGRLAMVKLPPRA